jgi:hypothetical protein
MIPSFWQWFHPPDRRIVDDSSKMIINTEAAISFNKIYIYSSAVIRSYIRVESVNCFMCDSYPREAWSMFMILKTCKLCCWFQCGQPCVGFSSPFNVSSLMRSFRFTAIVRCGDMNLNLNSRIIGFWYNSWLGKYGKEGRNILYSGNPLILLSYFVCYT